MYKLDKNNGHFVGLFTVLSSNDELHSVTPFGSAGYGEFFLTTYAFLHYRIVVEGINQVVPAHIHGTADFFSTAHHVHTIEFEQQTDGSVRCYLLLNREYFKLVCVYLIFQHLLL